MRGGSLKRFKVYSSPSGGSKQTGGGIFQIALEHLGRRTHKLWKDYIYQTFVTRKLITFQNATPTRALLLWVMAR